MQYDRIVTLKVLELIRECEYDFILAYHQEYDDGYFEKHDILYKYCIFFVTFTFSRIFLSAWVNQRKF